MYKNIFILTLLLSVPHSFSYSVEPKQLQTINGVGAFYRTTEGSVAFMPHADNKAEALKATKFRLLPESGPYNLNRRNEYWFIVNHKTEEKPKVTYLGVKILLIYPEMPDTDTSVYLFRNEDWVRKNDKEFKGSTESEKEFFTDNITIDQFIEYHKSEINISDLDDKLGYKWHAIPSDSDKFTWNDKLRWKLDFINFDQDLRNQFSKPLPENFGVIYEGYLIRFSTTNKNASKNRLVFKIIGNDKVAAYIYIFSPDSPRYNKRFLINFVDE